MAADSTIKPRPAPQFSLRLIFGITLVAAVMFALLRWAVNPGFGNDDQRAFFVVIWGGFGFLLLAQIFCTAWAWPLLRQKPDGPTSKRQKRRRRALNICFGIGALPVIVWVFVTITIIAAGDDPGDVFEILLVVLLSLMAARLVSQILGLAIYGVCTDELPLVLMRLGILASAIYPLAFVFVEIVFDVW